MKKLLLSARDPGAAGNIAVLYEDLLKTGCFDVSLIASGAAWSILKNKGCNPISFEISENKDHIDPSASNENLLNEKKLLIERTSEILKKTRPDAVITGLSSFGAGIDEALAFLADVPVFAVQDFWGDVNLSIGKPADVYLVMDEFAAEITKKRCGAETEIIGSPKYSRYASLDIGAMREESRKYLKASNNDKIIGWFGQHPEIPGYRSVFESFIRSVKKIDCNIIIMFREHPKFGQESVRNAEKLCSRDIRAVDVTGICEAEKWISACDLLVTPYSLCAVDHAYMSALSPVPMGNVLFLMNNKKIMDFFIQTTGISRIPTVDSGLGNWMCDEYTDPACLMEKMIGEKACAEYYCNASRISWQYNKEKILKILLSV